MAKQPPKPAQPTTRGAPINPSGPTVTPPYGAPSKPKPKGK
jgi:hypothetical protein